MDCETICIIIPVNVSFSIDTNIDPSLHERQRLLKRSRLLDDLNDKLYHRPGPLELVQGNILQPPPELVNAIRGELSMLFMYVLILSV